MTWLIIGRGVQRATSGAVDDERWMTVHPALVVRGPQVDPGQDGRLHHAVQRWLYDQVPLLLANAIPRFFGMIIVYRVNYRKGLRVGVLWNGSEIIFEQFYVIIYLGWGLKGF